MIPMKSFLLSLILLFPFAHMQGEIVLPKQYTVIEDAAKIPIHTPSIALWQKEKIKLANGLEAYLISDPAANVSGALLSVNVGSWDDPAEYPGIAHFLEHMLFLGTKRYPKESEYQQFINENGGETNAFTASSTTNYLFTVNNDVFEEGLKRFSSFFKEPLFNPSGVSRELQAIDQEYAKNLEEDGIRQFYVMKALMNPDHPFHHFNMGNSQTLSNVSRQTLENWYRSHYDAHLMRLVVYSPLPIEKLRQRVVADFNRVPTRNRKPLEVEKKAFTEESQGHYVYIEPIRDSRRLTLVWELPSSFVNMRDTQPERIVSHVLGHEGEHSLLAQLKREQLAESLCCAGIKLGDHLFTFFLQIDLTNEGLRDVDQVINRTFQAIQNFREQGVPDYLFDEIKKMQTIQYQYQSKGNEFLMLMQHAQHIHDEKELATYPEVTNMIQRFDPQAVKEMLGALKPGRANVFIMAPSTLTGQVMDRKEQWIGVDYALTPIPQETMEEWEHPEPHSKISLPQPNIFIPNDLQIISKPRNTRKKPMPTPNLLVDDSTARIYFAHDDLFNVPKISWILHIRTPEITLDNAMKVVIADLYVKSLNDALTKFSYPAQIAGLDFEITRGNNGIKIEIGGYSQNAHLLLNEILHTISTFEPSRDTFHIFKDSLLRQYQNFSKESPLQQSLELFKSVLFEHYVLEKEKAGAIRKLSFKKFQEAVAQLFDSTFIEGMFYGNMTTIQAEKLAGTVKETFVHGVYPKEEQRQVAVMVLPQNEGPFYVEARTQSQGNAVVLAIEENTYSFKENAAQQILMQSIKEPFFSTLRTKQQTGYLVHSFPQEIERKLFDLFAVQSNTHHVNDLLHRFEAFIESYLQEMGKTELTEEQFYTIKKCLLKNLEEPAKTINEMGALLFTFAFQYDGDFDWINKRVKGFEQLTYAECLKMARESLGKHNKRRLAILLQGPPSENSPFTYKQARTLNTVRKLSEYAQRS
ncbi:MAG: insulinase family protein [Waddliaceae bacterium]